MVCRIGIPRLLAFALGDQMQKLVSGHLASLVMYSILPLLRRAVVGAYQVAGAPDVGGEGLFGQSIKPSFALSHCLGLLYGLATIVHDSTFLNRLVSRIFAEVSRTKASVAMVLACR